MIVCLCICLWNSVTGFIDLLFVHGENFLSGKKLLMFMIANQIYAVLLLLILAQTILLFNGTEKLKTESQWRIKVRNPQMLSRVKRLSIKAGWPDRYLMANVCRVPCSRQRASSHQSLWSGFGTDHFSNKTNYLLTKLVGHGERHCNGVNFLY